ncbi:MAG: tetratricopeptide repeat protein [Acidobacteriota bacterium]
MKRLATALLWIAAATISPAAGAAERKDKAPEEPFYRRFLAPGNPLDDRILEQEKKVEADPGSPALHNDFGNLLAARRFPREAREQYEIAMKLDPKSSLAPYNLGLLAETEGQTGRAIRAYERSVDRNRGFPAARFRLGRLYEKRGRMSDAIEQYARALQIDPSMRDVRRNPLVADTQLLARVSLVNYEKDMARASLSAQGVFADPALASYRRAPVDRPVWSDEVADPTAPEPVDRSRASEPRPATGPVPIAPGPREIRPQDLGPAYIVPAPASPAPAPSSAEPGPPSSPPIPEEAAPPPPPGTTPRPPDAYDPLGLRPKPPQPTPPPPPPPQ